MTVLGMQSSVVGWEYSFFCSIQRLAAEIKEELGPETFVYRIRIGESSSEDRSSSFFDDVNRQVPNHMLTSQFHRVD